METISMSTAALLTLMFGCGWSFGLLCGFLLFWSWNKIERRFFWKKNPRPPQAAYQAPPARQPPRPVTEMVVMGG